MTYVKPTAAAIAEKLEPHERFSLRLAHLQEEQYTCTWWWSHHPELVLLGDRKGEPLYLWNKVARQEVVDYMDRAVADYARRSEENDRMRQLLAAASGFMREAALELEKGELRVGLVDCLRDTVEAIDGLSSKGAEHA